MRYRRRETNLVSRHRECDKATSDAGRIAQPLNDHADGVRNRIPEGPPGAPLSPANCLDSHSSSCAGFENRYVAVGHPHPGCRRWPSADVVNESVAGKKDFLLGLLTAKRGKGRSRRCRIPPVSWLSRYFTCSIEEFIAFQRFWIFRHFSGRVGAV